LLIYYYISNAAYKGEGAAAGLRRAGVAARQMRQPCGKMFGRYFIGAEKEDMVRTEMPKLKRCCH